MTWYFHKLTTVSLVYAVSGDATASVIAGGASVLPDAIEFPFGGALSHRTITHWPYLYLVLAVGFGFSLFVMDQVLMYFGFWVCIGCLLHVAQDSLSKTGVPFLSPFGQKKGAGLYKVYSFSEFLVAVSIIVPCFFVASVQGRLEVSYFQGEIHRSMNLFKDFFWVFENMISKKLGI